MMATMTESQIREENTEHCTRVKVFYILDILTLLPYSVIN